MFTINEYFEGKVKSIAYNNAEGHQTIGIMATGEYEFGTATKEIMTVISGSLSILQPGEDIWKTYKPYESFEVAKDVKFLVKVFEDSTYKCLYI